MKLNFHHIQHVFLSPGNIFWKKKSGANLLISKKGDALNRDLIDRLTNSGAEIFIEDQIDFHAIDEACALYARYSEEVLMREKIEWRNKFISILVSEFVTKENSPQSDLDILAWKLFSSLDASEGMKFFEKDSDLFKRNLNVASSYAVCAFLLGYYETQFLSKLFTTTLQNLMELGNSARVLSLKEKLEYLRLQESFNSEDCQFVKEIVSPEILKKTVLFEKYDGSGPRHLNSREMTDLEVVFVALSETFSYSGSAPKNILWLIQHGEFKCQARRLKMLQRVLNKREDELLDASA